MKTPRSVGWAGSVLVFMLGSSSLHGQVDGLRQTNPKTGTIFAGQSRVSSPFAWPDSASPARDLAVVQPGVGCLPRCDSCWLGGPFQQDCLTEWLDNDFCDCGCQFADNSDCGSNCSCPSACDWCWCNTTAQNACPSSWNGDGECDCACQFADIDCPGTTPTGACCAANGSCSVTTSLACSNSGGTYRGNNVTCAQANCPSPMGACCSAAGVCTVVTSAVCTGQFGAYQGNATTCGPIDCPGRCAAGCEYCWVGTPFHGSCDSGWRGDGSCDCGCQFPDPDCGPRGACCGPANGLCASLTQVTCRFFAAGVFRGVGVSCAAVNCDRCDVGCAWCWIDTIAEHACLAEWDGDAECDCGCQFADSDCGSGVCGNLVCEESARSCAADCMDLRALAEFQNCFGPGQSTPPACMSHVYAAPTGIGLEDFSRFFDLLSGP